jgi:hypothetical protein
MQLRMTVKVIPPLKVFNLSKVTRVRRFNIRMYCFQQKDFSITPLFRRVARSRVARDSIDMRAARSQFSLY